MIIWRRAVGALCGAFAGAVLYGVYRLFRGNVPISGLAGVARLVVPGLLGGAVVGAVWPRPFVWAVEQLVNICP